MSTRYGNSLAIVTEAAECREDQWRGAANGDSIDNLVTELYEAQESDRYRDTDECFRMHRMQREAIDDLASQLPAKPYQSDIDMLAVTAMCIWEAMLERISRAESREERDEAEAMRSWLAKGEGAFSAREGCWALSGWADWAWDHAESNGYLTVDAFDWEFIPLWIDELYKLAVLNSQWPDTITEDVARRAAMEACDYADSVSILEEENDNAS